MVPVKPLPKPSFKLRTFSDLQEKTFNTRNLDYLPRFDNLIGSGIPDLAMDKDLSRLDRGDPVFNPSQFSDEALLPGLRFPEVGLDGQGNDENKKS